MKVLSLIPPMTQLNTPYPSTAYLTGFLRSRGIDAVQEDLALALVLGFFTPEGLLEIRQEALGVAEEDRSASVNFFLDYFDEYQSTISLVRRTFIASAALTPVACGGLSYEHGTPVTQPNPLPTIRPPQVGQEWTYIKKNVFDGKTKEIVNERVKSIGSTIVIEQNTTDGYRLPDEIQSPWGMVTLDPQWPRLFSFSPALPLWPEKLSITWAKQFNAKYSIGGYCDSKMNWQQYMSVHGWEKISVPAGEFVALRFQNLINYESDDPNKVDCIRKETFWFVPQIGRWVARETSGSYQIQGQIGAVILEGSY